MKQIIVILLLLVSGLSQAQVSMQTEVTSIPMGEAFRIVLTRDDSTPSGLPDLAPLQVDFNIVGTEQNTNYSIINGQSSTTSQWTILLMPKRTGRLTIPSIRFGQDATQASSIEVTADNDAPANPQSVDTQKDVMLTATVSTEHPYVNEQVLYTVKLYNSKRLLDASFKPPVITDGLLIPLGDGKRYQTTENGRIYLVEEQQYAIFAQKSGELKITAPVFNALIFNDTPEQVKATVDDTTLNVQAAPVNFKGKNWFPAKEVSLREEYDSDTSLITEGSTLVRTITLQATGLPAQLLPTLTMANNGDFNLYPDKPVENNKLQQNNLIGTRTIKITYLFNKSGKIVIPAQRLEWFNTVTAREEIASLPELTLNVRANANASPVDNALTKQSTADNSSAKTSKTALAPDNSFAWWLAAGFAMAWVVTLLLWRRPKRHTKTSTNTVLKELREACLAGDAEQARVALIGWANQQWPETKVLTLAEISKLTNDHALQEQINALSDALYQSNQQPWCGERLWQCVESYKEKPLAKNTHKKPLPPLNPEI